MTSTSAAAAPGDISGLSLNALAALARKKRACDQTDVLPSADPVEPDLSFAQERLWFMDRLVPGNPFYNLPFCIEIEGPLDVGALIGAINDVVARHEPLRTIFPAGGSSARQKILPSLVVDAPLEDLRARSAEEQEAVVQAAMRAEAATPYDIASGPLLRARLFRRTDDLHVLVYGFHHIAFDGWSIAVFNSELMAFYAARAQGAAITPPAPRRYADFALWERKQLEGPRRSEIVEYWRARLAGLPSLQLPTDRRRPPVQTFAGGTAFFRLSAESRRAVESLAREMRATPFMVMLAAFQAAMARCADQERFVMGASIAGRTHPATQDMVGFFVNNLPIRCDLSGEPSFGAVVERARDELLETAPRQSYPFQDLVDALEGGRDLSRNAVYQVSFTYQPAPLSGASVAGLALRSVPVRTDATHMDFEVLAWPDGDGILFCVIYASDLFDESAVARFFEAFRRTLEAGLAEPDRAITELPVAAPEELACWAKIDGPPATRGAAIWDVVRGQAARRERQDALILPSGRRVSWDELMEEVERFAGSISTAAPKAGPVAIRLFPGLAHVSAILAALRLGRPFVPVDPRRPQEAVEDMLRSVGVEGLLTDRALWSGASDGESSFITLDVDALPAGTAPPPYRRPTDEDPIFIQFTSGSLGRPKPVEINHGAFANRLPWALSVTLVGEGERGCLKTSPAFVDAIGELLDSLALGMTLVAPDPDVARSPRELLRLIESAGVTRLMATPSLAEAMLEVLGDRELPLRHLILGGENVRTDLAARLLDALPKDARLVNFYGSTELTSDAASHVITRDDLAAGPVHAPIGDPLPGVTLWLLDSRGRLAAPGSPGEIHVSGANLATGYRGAPDLTRAAFRDWRTPEGETIRLYATGDVATRRADGKLVCLGRRDHQIKIRGMRIEAGEIETRLREHPDVADALVTLRRGSSGADDRLLAHVLRRAGADCATQALRAHLARFLPQSVMPGAIVVLDAWPLTGTGKIDRHALPEPSTTGVEGAAPKPPENDLQRALLAIWREALGREDIGVNDSFFEAGGNSLLLARVHHRVCGLVGRDVPLTALFQHPTIASLADRLAAADGPPEASDDALRRAEARRQALRGRRRSVAAGGGA